MSWTLYRWVWLLKAPLFVGVPPAGALNRCRLYILSRGIWGGLTAELAQASASESFPNYQEYGKAIRRDARFTYLYPAARVDESWLAWLPRHVPGKGLSWCREDQLTAGDAAVPDRRFRRWLIDTRPGTAIDPDSDSAAEATLRETECVMARWRLGSPVAESQVAVVGYAFLRDSLTAGLDQVTTLFLGGDTRYGLGRMERVKFERADSVFGASTVLDEKAPIIVSSTLLSHGVSSRPLHGAKEALTGWDRTATDPLMCAGEARWSPGSQTDTAVRWRIEEEGTWSDSA